MCFGVANGESQPTAGVFSLHRRRLIVTRDGDSARLYARVPSFWRVVRPTTPCACFSKARGVYRWGRASEPDVLAELATSRGNDYRRKRPLSVCIAAET
jgi:hypothetical protein